VVEQKATAQGIKMSKGVESILLTREETIVLPRVEPTITKGVHVVVKIKYNVPKLNQ
jgi:hypothetical protein